MAVLLSDIDIERLVGERKPLPKNYRRRLSPKPKRGHREAEMSVTGTGGSQFSVVIRQASQDPLDFSVILRYHFAQSNRVFRLRRYNGKSHEHTNKLEGNTFDSFHIHRATERYQDSGLAEDAFAEATDRYGSIEGAVECFLEDCAFDLPEDGQMMLSLGGSG
jgi:hypothetical protein